ncbi:MAG: integral rane protein [Chloroflexi bacterium]|nr:integral rane protein [Chloroflexota bacterium]
MAEVAASSAPAAAALRVVAAIIIGAAVTLLLISGAVRWVTLSQTFYLSEFSKYRVGEITRLGPDQLQAVAQAFGDYFQSPPGELVVTVELPGGRQALFNEREIAHMRDVQVLMHRVFQTLAASIVMLVLGMILAIATDRPAGLRAITVGLAGGGITTVLLVGLLGLASLLDFERLFLQFHFVSFTNDLWTFDPRTDRLIQLFPEGFFFDAATRIATSSVVLGAVIAAISLGIQRLIPDS